MDSEYIQLFRSKLRNRLKRFHTAAANTLHSVLVQTWSWLQENDISRGILADLVLHNPTTDKLADNIVGNNHKPPASTESINNAICFWVLNQCVVSDDTITELKLGRVIVGQSRSEDSKCIEAFRVTYVEPLFDYIDEHIDDKRMTLVLLKKYKHRCEWFHRAALFKKYKTATSKGEKTLATSLYEYLHDQGIPIHIEPQSASGRIDFISAQTGRDRLVADAKLFNPKRSQGCGYIIKGFRQIYDYVKEYNESFGYLVIFKTCEQDLSIPTQHQEGGVPFITHNNKTIFLVVIDIFDYPKSASKRGKLKAYEITPAEFVEALA